MRFVALGCVLLAGGTALGQPAPDGAPDGEPTAPLPDPVAPPSVPVTPPPTTPQVPPAPAPPQAPVTEVPAAKTAKQTATELRLAAQAACDAHDSTCDWVATFSSLERASIRRTLAALKLEPDPAPWNKVIGHIYIRNEDVFAEKNWLRFFNLFHVTTRDATIRSELTIGEGEVWDEELVAETARRVKDPLYTSVVAVVPVKSADSTKVDMVVVTRDIWSLRLNTKWDIQGQSLRGFTMSLSENNFLGRRKTVAFGFIMDQGAIATGPLYIDKNFLNEHIDLRARYEKILTRKSLDVVSPDGTSMPTGDPKGIQDGGGLNSEGTAATLSASKTLWSLASKWGYGASAAYSDSVSRAYFFSGLRSYDDTSTPETEALPREYRIRTWSTRASVTRQWGGEYKHGIEAGYSVGSQQPTVLGTPAFAVDPTLLAHFRDDVFPRDEVVSNPYVEYSVYRTKFTTLRNVDTYELAEDLRFGPNLTAGISQSFKSLGSTYRFARPSLSAGWTFPWGRDGYTRVSAGGQLRIQEGRTIDNTATGSVRATTPTLTYVRLIANLHLETRWHDESNSYYTLGSESGLRAYNVAQFYGDRRVVGQLEARSVPYGIWFVRVGGVLFYEGGGAADTFRTMRYFHDVGVGLRMLIPQSSRELFRFDLAFPLVASEGTTAGLPRFIAGFDSYF